MAEGTTRPRGLQYCGYVGGKQERLEALEVCEDRGRPGVLRKRRTIIYRDIGVGGDQCGEGLPADINRDLPYRQQSQASRARASGDY